MYNDFDEQITILIFIGKNQSTQEAPPKKPIGEGITINWWILALTHV